MNPIELFDKLINEHGSSTILRERIELLKDHFMVLANKEVQLTAEITKLTKENSQLAHRLHELENQLSAVAVTQQFVEERGALFKRRPDGTGFHNAVYCPKCNGAASIGMFPDDPFCCDSCHWHTIFPATELPAILAGLK